MAVPALRFGTDGVRGVANVELTPEWALALGRIAAKALCANGESAIVIGRDTRESGGMLAAALSAGAASEGVDVVDVGVLTTPGIAWVAAERRIPAAVVSASHNPYTDNGVKLFGAGGSKLSDYEQRAIEEAIGNTVDDGRESGHVGTVDADPAAAQSYMNHLAASVNGRRLDGMRVVVDCANGAASEVAPDVISRLGADVVTIGNAPDGRNINEGCGSTALDLLMAEVVARHADVGLAFDGDADRCLAVDHLGRAVDGDRMLALFGGDRHAQGRLAAGTVVVTVMSNLGFRLAMEEKGIRTVVTDVGDRNVLVAMERECAELGGEQSGHVIFRDLATTGDGILTGLQLLDLIGRSGEPLAELADRAMTTFPQVLVSVTVPDTALLDTARDVWGEVARIESELGGTGRILVRPSGTEPKVRIMVEATSEDAASKYAEIVRACVERELCRK